MRITMLGPPGSGKGTQAAKLAEEFGVPHVGTGVMFREIMQEDTPLGKEIKNLVDNGILVSDEKTNEVLDNRVVKDDARKGIILDGYPRNLNQVKHLEEVYPVDFVIEVEVRDEECVKRISSRRTCPGCKAEFNVIFLPPKEEGKCDYCQKELEQRGDAKPEVVQERLKIYHDLTAPISKYYEEKRILLKVNGEQPIQKVFDDILKSISVAQQQ